MYNNVVIRKAKIDDVEQINDIINHSIKTSYSNWAWNERSYEKAKEWFYEHNNKQHCIFVSTENDKVTGYGSLSKLRAKEGYWPVVENSVYVHKDYRGKKIGTALMNVLIKTAIKYNLWAISAWIDSGNTKSIVMHKKFGFYIIGELKNIGEKFNKKRSVTIMQLDLNECEVIND